MITTTSECSSHWPSAPVATPANEATITPPIPARNDPTKNVTANTMAMLMPRARTIDWSATPARITMPIRVRLSHSHSKAPTTMAMAEDEQPAGGVALAEDLDEVGDAAGPRHRLGQAAGAGEHLVGEDHRDGQRDQRLAQLLALVPAQEHLEDHQPDDRRDRRADEQRDDPRQHVDVLGGDVALLADHPLLDLDGDVGGEQEQRAVGHVDRAHQAEDQREPGGDDEVQPGRGQPVEEGDDELAGFADGRAGRRATGEEQHPGEHQGDRDGTDDRPLVRSADASRPRRVPVRADPMCR